MDIDAIRLFVRAAARLNISAAGRELGLAPAVSSARLAKLERTLGVALFHRTTRKVALSRDGAEFLPFATEILAQADAAAAVLGKATAAASGTVRFAAPSSFATLYIAPLLPAFLAAHPGVNLDLRLADAPRDLIEGSFDLALRNQALADTSLKARVLARDTRVLCASPAYLAQRGVPREPLDLAAHDLIAFMEDAPRRLIGPDGATAAFDPAAATCRLTVDDGAAQRALTLAGAGISSNALWSVAPHLADGTLTRVLPLWEVDDKAALWLVYPKSNVLTLKVRVLIDYLVATIGARPPWLSAP